LRWNSFIDRYELTGLKGHRYLSDKSAAELWGRAHKIKFRVDKGFQRDCLEVLALRQEVHPVRDYFDGLLDKWDGVARLDLWLPAYLKAAENDYTCAVGAKTLIAAVRRIRQPGTKFDQLLILEGEQGTGKSTALKILTTREGWFTDCVSLTNDPKIMIEQTEGKLIVEVPELKGMRKAEIEHVKATLSRTHDRARKAYGRYTDEVPRQFILIGTTNTEKGGECWYLKDPTGNRRFWPVKTAEIDLERLERDRDQLWAEAVAREAMGESIELPRELWNAAQLEQQARMERDPWVEELGNELGDFEGKLLTTDARLIVSRNLANWGAFQNERLGRAMRELGWQRKYLRHKKGRAYFYVKGEEPWRKVLVTVESSSQVSLRLDKREDGEHGA
jgi:predicted P-loop ATPase